MEDIRKEKGNVWGVVFTDAFFFFAPAQNSMLLFWSHAGNGSSVCQRLTLHRVWGREKEERGIKEDRADKHKSLLFIFLFFKQGESESARNLFLFFKENNWETQEEICDDGGSGSWSGEGVNRLRWKPRPHPSLGATLIMHVCIKRN